MNSELNLELYTIAMTRLNNGFAKIGDIIQDNTDLINSSTDAEDFNKLAIKIKRTLPDFRKSSSEFEEFYNDIVNDLSQDEINVNEYQPFFEHVDEVFPAYESQLNDGIAGLKESIGGVNPKIDNFLTEAFLQVKENGIEKTLTKKNMKELYKKYCIDDKTEYRYEFKGEWKEILKK